ncbi:MAG: hypothetical protein RL291_1631 [Pseudomonadota bacterium]
MKKFLLGSAIAALAIVPAVAQQAPAPSAPSAPSASTPPASTPAPAPAAKTAAPAASPSIPKGIFVRGATPAQYMMRDRLIGAKVYNKEGQIIGDIEDVILGRDINDVQGIVMGTGGFLGAGEKKVGVRYTALRFSTKDGKTTITLPEATKEVLAALPAFVRPEPTKSALERAREKARELTDKTKATSTPALEKAGEATKTVIEKGKQAIGVGTEKAPAPTAPKQ